MLTVLIFQEGCSGELCIFTKCPELAQPNSVYCSPLCILRHAHESLVLLAREKVKQFGGKGKEEVGMWQRSVFNPYAGSTKFMF